MSWKKEEDEEDQEEELDESEFKSVDDRIVFLIDARHAMLETNKLGEVHLKNCLQVALEVMKSKIIASDKSSIGVIFFGTKNKDADGAMEGVFTLFPPEIPSATRVRQLQDIIEDIQNFHSAIGSQDPKQEYCPLREALWVCSQAFHVKATSQKASDFRRVWVFTNDDHPNAHSSTENEKTIKVAKDCAETGIEISLWHLNRMGNAPFDPSIFYMKMMSAATPPGNEDEDDEESLADRMKGAGFDGFDAMMANVRRKQHKKRRLASLTFSLHKSMSVPMAVQLYKLLSVAKKPAHTWLYARSNEPLKVISKFIDGETGASLDASTIATYVDCGGSRLAMTAEEMKVLKYGGPVTEGVRDDVLGDEAEEDAVVGGGAASIQLLFCTPSTNLSPHLSVDASYFLFPDDASVAHSSLLLSSLVLSLDSTQKMAIVSFQRTKSSGRRLAACLPQLEQLDEDGVQICPGGLNLILLPFAEEIRNTPLPLTAEMQSRITEILYAEEDPSSSGKSGNELTRASASLVQALQLDSSFCYYKDLESPAMQQFYSILQAVALSQQTPEYNAERDDKMHADAASVALHADVIDRFKQVSGISDFSADDVKPKKRAAPAKKSGDDGAEPKKSRGTSGGGEDWRALAAAGNLMSLTGAALKEICQSLGLAYSGTKAAQIARITDAI